MVRGLAATMTKNMKLMGKINLIGYLMVLNICRFSNTTKEEEY